MSVLGLWRTFTLICALLLIMGIALKFPRQYINISAVAAVVSLVLDLNMTIRRSQLLDLGP